MDPFTSTEEVCLSGTVLSPDLEQATELATACSGSADHHQQNDLRLVVEKVVTPEVPKGTTSLVRTAPPRSPWTLEQIAPSIVSRSVEVPLGEKLGVLMLALAVESKLEKIVSSKLKGKLPIFLFSIIFQSAFQDGSEKMEEEVFLKHLQQEISEVNPLEPFFEPSALSAISWLTETHGPECYAMIAYQLGKAVQQGV